MTVMKRMDTAVLKSSNLPSSPYDGAAREGGGGGHGSEGSYEVITEQTSPLPIQRGGEGAGGGWGKGGEAAEQAGRTDMADDDEGGQSHPDKRAVSPSVHLPPPSERDASRGEGLGETRSRTDDQESSVHDIHGIPGGSVGTSQLSHSPLKSAMKSPPPKLTGLGADGHARSQEKDGGGVGGEQQRADANAVSPNLSLPLASHGTSGVQGGRGGGDQRLSTSGVGGGRGSRSGDDGRTPSIGGGGGEGPVSPRVRLSSSGVKNVIQTNRATDEQGVVGGGGGGDRGREEDPQRQHSSPIPPVHLPAAGAGSGYPPSVVVTGGEKAGGLGVSGPARIQAARVSGVQGNNAGEDEDAADSFIKDYQKVRTAPFTYVRPHTYMHPHTYRHTCRLEAYMQIHVDVYVDTPRCTFV